MPPALRHDWTRAEVLALLDLPFPELMARAGATHREHFDPREVQVSTLLSIKTGGCPEDCAYCPQAARYNTGLKAHKLLTVEEVVEKATAAKAPATKKSATAAKKSSTTAAKKAPAAKKATATKKAPAKKATKKAG